MNIKNVLIFLLILVSFNSCEILKTINDEEYYYSGDSDIELNSSMSSETNESAFPDEERKCYEKGLVSHRSWRKKLPVYTGDKNLRGVDLETREVVLKPAVTKWVKKKDEENCVSSAKDDCLFWHFINTPGTFEEILIVTDTSQTRHYEYRVVEVKTNSLLSEWTQIVCDYDVSGDLIKQIQNTLREMDYYFGSTTGILDTETEEAILSFQKQRNLAQGHLFFSTLEAMEISMDDY